MAQGRRDEAFLLRVAAPLEQRGGDHRRPHRGQAPGHAAGGELLQQDRVADGVRGLLGAAEALGDVAVQVAARDRALAEQRVLALGGELRLRNCGTHIGLVEATIRYALDHEKLSDAARQMMQSALDELGVVET